MKTFIKSTILFFIVLVTGIVLLIEIPEFIVGQKAEFMLPKKSTYIVLGHSHSECALIDSLIPDLSNLASSGESYFYTYFKVKKVLEQNSEIETVLIEYSNNQITSIMNDWIWDDEHLNYRYATYSSMMEFEDKWLLASNNFGGFINANSLATKKNVTRIASNDYAITLSSEYSSSTMSPDLDSLIANAINDENRIKMSKISTVNLQYLSKIIQLCTKKGKKVILFRSPLHARYGGYANESMYQAIRKKRFSSIKYLDFSKFELRNSDYYDLEHLNQAGAKKFTTWFKNQLTVLENNMKRSN